MIDYDMMVEDAVSLRPNCTYTLLDTEPEGGRYWAICIVPVEFPTDDYVERAGDGSPVELAVMAAAQRRPDLGGGWTWCTLSPTAKHVFGDMLFKAQPKTHKWSYMLEEETHA